MLFALPNELIRAILQFTHISDIVRLQVACGKALSGFLNEVCRSRVEDEMVTDAVLDRSSATLRK